MNCDCVCARDMIFQVTLVCVMLEMNGVHFLGPGWQNGKEWIIGHINSRLQSAFFQDFDSCPDYSGIAGSLLTDLHSGFTYCSLSQRHLASRDSELQSFRPHENYSYQILSSDSFPLVIPKTPSAEQMQDNDFLFHLLSMVPPIVL